MHGKETISGRGRLSSYSKKADQYFPVSVAAGSRTRIERTTESSRAGSFNLIQTACDIWHSNHAHSNSINEWPFSAASPRAQSTDCGVSILQSWGQSLVLDLFETTFFPRLQPESRHQWYTLAIKQQDSLLEFALFICYNSRAFQEAVVYDAKCRSCCNRNTGEI